MTEPTDSLAPASAAHHGQGAPSGRRLPTEASASEDGKPWPRVAAFGSGGAEGEPRVCGEGAELPGAGSGAEPRDGRGSGPSSLDTLDITRRTQEKCAQRREWIATLDEPTRAHRTQKAERLRAKGRRRRARLRNAGVSEAAVQSGSRWHDQRAAAEIDRINRVLACGNEALVITCQGCGAQHERGQGCGASRFCLTCRGVSAAELRGKFLAAREDVVAEATDARLLDPRRRGGPYGDKFLTLTVPHVGTDTIARRIERVLAAWTVFLRLLNDYFKARVIRRL